MAYQDLLSLWKDADPDIPIYQQTKAEYARLRYRRVPSDLAAPFAYRADVLPTVDR